MVLLSLGCCANVRHVHWHLATLHAEHTISTILDARTGGQTSSAVYEWAKHIKGLDRIDWTGPEVGRGWRPQVIRERLRTVVAAAHSDARVIVWGGVPVFSVEGKRMRAQDVPAGQVVEAVLDAGRGGWMAAGARLVTLA